MNKIFSILLLLLLINIPAQAFQDYVVIGNGKLSDINIENNDIIDVFPMITVMNDKNTLFIQPLKIGKTKFSVLQDKKKIISFDVEVLENETKISHVAGFENFILDEPINNAKEEDYDFLDLPPEVRR